MKHKKFIIMLSISIVFLVTSIVLFVIYNPFKDRENNQKSDELIKYEAMFKLELINNQEYYIYELKNSKLSEVKIPATIDNIPVTKLIAMDDDFDSFKHVSTLVISKNIKYIGTYANDNTLGTRMLLNATGLVNINVDEENSYFASKDGILYSKDMKTLLKYPSSKGFGTNLFTVEIEENVEKIYNYAFYRNSIITRLICNDKLITIGDFAFSKCTQLNEVLFKNQLESLGFRTFEDCDKLSSISIPASVKEIKSSCFYGCNALTKLEILSANSELALGEHCFSETAEYFTINVDENIAFWFDKDNSENKLIYLGFMSQRKIVLNGVNKF